MKKVTGFVIDVIWIRINVTWYFIYNKYKILSCLFMIFLNFFFLGSFMIKTTIKIRYLLHAVHYYSYRAIQCYIATVLPYNFSASNCEPPMVDPGFLKGGFEFQLDKNTSPVWVEKKKVIDLHSYMATSLSQQSSFSHIAIIANKTTVIRTFRFDCSIRESQSDCSIRVFKPTGLKSISKRGFLGKPWSSTGCTTAY